MKKYESYLKNMIEKNMIFEVWNQGFSKILKPFILLFIKVIEFKIFLIQVKTYFNTFLSNFPYDKIVI